MSDLTNQLFRACSFFTIRVPLLPVSVVPKIFQLGIRSRSVLNTSNEVLSQDQTQSVRAALAAANLTFLDALDSGSEDEKLLEGKLLDYFVRMSTRPTPFGMLAGVAVGKWGESTNISPPESRATMTKASFPWIESLVGSLESKKEILTSLELMTNPAILVRGSRAVIPERVSPAKLEERSRVSVRLTKALKLTLESAQWGIQCRSLERLLTRIKKERGGTALSFIRFLVEQKFLLTNLNPPISNQDQLAYVMDKLRTAKAEPEIIARLTDLKKAMNEFDSATAEEKEDSFRKLVETSRRVPHVPMDEPIVVDSAVRFESVKVSRLVAREVEKAVEFLLSLSCHPQGPSILDRYHELFDSWYGEQDEIEVPLLEFLDKCLAETRIQESKSDPELKLAKGVEHRRNRALLDLAVRAIRNRQTIVSLDKATTDRITTCRPNASLAPVSVDVGVSIVASSQEAIDRGEFQVVIGPLVESGAGRSLGRFAWVIGDEAISALKEIVKAEDELFAGKQTVGFVSMPTIPRAANVASTPMLRAYEVDFDTVPSVTREHTILLSELVIGKRNGRFYVRSPSLQKEIVFRVGHMLNEHVLPEIAQFLTHLSEDGLPQLEQFDWGPAESFPFLPRVEWGKAILRPAQWRIDSLTLERGDLDPSTPQTFRTSLRKWRKEWKVPEEVYAKPTDYYLREEASKWLNLSFDRHVEDLRTLVLQVRREVKNFVLLEEAFTSACAWIPGPNGNYASEIVASLVVNPDTKVVESRIGDLAAKLPSQTERAKAPSSDWLYLKLCCSKDVEEEIISSSVPSLARKLLRMNLIDGWFFVRYPEPVNHLRFRFHLRSRAAFRRVVPLVSSWASRQLQSEICTQFSFETYLREVERYGGVTGLRLVERLFCADSLAVAEILRLEKRGRLNTSRMVLAAASVDRMLADLGFSVQGRLEWYRERSGVIPKGVVASKSYLKDLEELRSFLQGTDGKQPHDAALLERVLNRRAVIIRSIGRQLSMGHQSGRITKSLRELIPSLVHMHCNRLLGSSAKAEDNLIILLYRTSQRITAKI